jgi:threonine aldolase
LADYAATFDTVSVCFSKGLGAPVGSALVGPSDLIEKARFYRKQQGGAMRQVGILAAAAQYALTHNRDRLAQDHDHCRQLAEGLCGIDGIEVDTEEVETNMVFIGTGKHKAATLAQKLDELGIRVLATAPSTLRAVTNLTFQADEVDRVIHAFKQIL